MAEREIHIPASILRCRAVAREFQFSSVRGARSLQLARRGRLIVPLPALSGGVDGRLADRAANLLSGKLLLPKGKRRRSTSSHGPARAGKLHGGMAFPLWVRHSKLDQHLATNHRGARILGPRADMCDRQQTTETEGRLPHLGRPGCSRFAIVPLTPHRDMACPDQAAAEDKMLPAAMLNGNVVVQTAFYDGARTRRFRWVDIQPTSRSPPHDSSSQATYSCASPSCGCGTTRPEITRPRRRRAGRQRSRREAMHALLRAPRAMSDPIRPPVRVAGPDRPTARERLSAVAF